MDRWYVCGIRMQRTYTDRNMAQTQKFISALEFVNPKTNSTLLITFYINKLD